MEVPPIPDNEPERLEALYRYGVLDTEFEDAYNELTLLASEICEVPISLVSLIDSERQWFKSRVGIDADQTSREVSFCGHAINGCELFEISDASKDVRFSDNPLVTSDPNIRFYAGAPLVTPEGFSIGTLCVIDTTPRQLTELQRRTLKTLAQQVIKLMELRLSFRRLQEHAEKIQDLNASKDKLFSVVSHDLRAPFTAILSFADLLAGKIDAATHPEEAKITEHLQSAGQAAFELVNNLLKWARAHTGKIAFAPEPVRACDLIDDVIDAMFSFANRKSVRLSRAGSSEDAILVDRSTMFSALQNLATNGVKFTPPGGSVTFRIERDEDRVSIVVEDTGVGMEEERVAGLFELGETKSTPGTDGEEGTGIGLMIVKEFVEKQGGLIAVESKPGEGTKFLLTFPRVATDLAQ